MLEAVRQIRGDIELAAAHVDGALVGLAKGDDARIEPMHQRPQRNQVERTLRNLQAMFHTVFIACQISDEAVA